MLNEDKVRCLQWRSRRGMLELDVLLEPFARNVLPLLNDQDQEIYARLLECEDPNLFNWFMGDSRPDDCSLSEMVDRVLECGGR